MIKKVFEIIDSIESINQKEYIGLHNGKSGIALFYHYCNLFIKKDNKYESNCIKNIEEVLEIINKGEMMPTYCAGIAGFGWVVAFLHKNNTLSDQDIELLDDLDDYLYNKMIFDFQRKDYDYLHGALGYGVYFLKRLHKNKCVVNLHTLVENIDSIAIKEEDGSIKWSSIKYKTENEILYNISLSHGLSSVINIMTRIYQAGINKEKCEHLINGAMKYLLKQEIDNKKFNSYFPSFSIESDEKLMGSRLGWCYGDLGIAVTIWHAGMAFNNSVWNDKAIEVLKHAATRRDLQKNSVMDAGLCHGAAGIGHIFYRMWWTTRLPEFKEAADYWFNETLKMAYHKDGLAGFKTWHGGENSGWENEVGLLEGVAGIGLALMTYHYQMEPTWDECLLLS